LEAEPPNTPLDSPPHLTIVILSEAKNLIL
jgi:hypothetical protein